MGGCISRTKQNLKALYPNCAEKDSKAISEISLFHKPANEVIIKASENSNNLSLDLLSKFNEVDITNVTKVQALWRGKQVRGKLHKDTGFHEIRSKTEVIGWRSPELRGILRSPKQIESNTESPSGTFKKVTHRTSGEFIGLSVKDNSHEIAQLPNEIIKKIAELKLKHIVVQFRVKENFYVVLDLGKNDLLETLCKNKILEKKCTPKLFKELILELEMLHEHEIIHRDIKLENLFYISESDSTNRKDKKSSGMYLTDLDFMGYIGELENAAGSPIYCPEYILMEPNLYGTLIDKICLLNTMLAAYYKVLPQKISKIEKAEFCGLFIKPAFSKWFFLLMNLPGEITSDNLEILTSKLIEKPLPLISEMLLF